MRIVTVAATALAVGAMTFVALTLAKTQTASAQSELNLTNKLPAVGNARLGEWEAVCDSGEPPKGLHTADMDQWKEGACHLRYIDIFSTGGRADSSASLGMIAAFIAPEEDGIRVEFGIAPGLSFEPDGFFLARNGFPVWKLENRDCLSEGVCTFSGPAADALVTAFSDASASKLEMQMEFTDSSGLRHSRQWPMIPFSRAFADFAAKQNPPMM